MNKKEIIAYFDRCAPQWDARMVTDDGKINGILDAAGVREHDVVLDVACGTGVCFPITSTETWRGSSAWPSHLRWPRLPPPSSMTHGLRCSAGTWRPFRSGCSATAA